MTGSSDTIKEFLVELGWKVDEAGAKKFNTAVVGISRSLVRMGAVGATAAAGLYAFVSTVSRGLTDLYWQSQRLRSSVQDVQDFQLAWQKLGGSAAEAKGMLEGIASELRKNPAAEGFIRSLGVQTRDANGDLRDTTGIVKDLGKEFKSWGKPGSQGYVVAAQVAEIFGIDEKSLYQMTQGLDQFENRYAKLFAAGGLDGDAMAKDAKEFSDSLLDLGANVDVLAKGFASALLPYAKDFTEVMDRVTFWLLEAGGAALQWFSNMQSGNVTGISAEIRDLIVNISDLAGTIGNVWTALEGNQSVVNAMTRVLQIINIILDLLTGKWQEALDDSKKLFENWAKDIVRGFENVGRGIKSFFTGAKEEKSQADNDASPAKDTKPPRDREAHAVQFLQRAGMSRDQSIGVVANLLRESNLKTDAVGDNGKAYGIAQWHPDRQRDFKDWAGKDIQKSSLDDQLGFLMHELTQGKEQRAGSKLAMSETMQEAAEAFARFYERPANVDAEALKRSAMAMQLNSRLGVEGSPMQMAANQNQGAGDVHVNQNTNITVNGGGDPHATGRAVADAQTGVDRNIIRSVKGAVR